MKAEDILEKVTEEINNMISTKTVIGEHIVIGGRTLIPVTKVSFGFGSGSGEGKDKSGSGGTGGGGGGGASIEPIAFVVITEEEVELLNIKGEGAISKLAEVMPEVMEKYRSSKEEEQKGKTEET